MEATHIVVTLIVSLLLVSCRDNGIGPVQAATAPIPFALAYRWTYVDSLYSTSGLAVDTFSTMVISSRSDAYGLWWKIDRPFNPSIAAVEFTASSDSLFSLQYTDTPAGGRAAIRSLEYLVPSGTVPIVFNSIFDGDVGIRKSISRSTEAISTIAGRFSNSLRLDYNIAGEVYRESVVPGVGMVDLEIINNSIIPAYQTWTRRRIQLLDVRTKL